MAESNIPVQPAPSSTPAAPAPVGIKTFTAVDMNGVIVQIQAIVLTDDVGRAFFPLTESTGREILAAIRLLDQHFIDVNGGLAPPQPGGFTGA